MTTPKPSPNTTLPLMGFPKMDPSDFIAKWKDTNFGEKQASQPMSMDICKLVGVAHEQRQRSETTESELADVWRRLERLYNLVETTDVAIDDFKPRIRAHRERQERLEATAVEARALLSQRRVVLDDVKTITAYAEDMSEFLNESELTERKVFIESFVKEVVMRPGNAVVRYSIPIPEDSRIPGGGAEEVAFHGPVLSTVKYGGLTTMVDTVVFETWLGSLSAHRSLALPMV